MLEISAPPASSSVRPLLNFPMADKKEGQPSKGSESGTAGSEVRVEGSEATGFGEGSIGFEGRDSRAEGSRGSTPATAASETEDTTTGAKGRVCGSGGGGEANATEGCSEGQGFPKGQRRQAECRQDQGEGTQGSGERQARQQHAEDKGAAEAAAGESSPEETFSTRLLLQGSGNQGGSRESCAEGCEKNAPQASAGLAEVQSSTREEVVGLPEKAQGQAAGQAAEGDSRVQHPDARDHDGDGPRGEAREAGRGSKVVRPAPGTAWQRPAVRGPVSAGGPEHSGGTSRSHHPRDGGDHGQDQLYKPVACTSSASASSSAAGCYNGGACRDGAGVTQQLLFGDGTGGAEDARCRNSSPGDACSPPPTTTLGASKKARTEEPQDREMAMASASAPTSPPPTRLAARTAKASSPAAKASSPGGHRLPPGVSWDDL